MKSRTLNQAYIMNTTAAAFYIFNLSPPLPHRRTASIKLSENGEGCHDEYELRVRVTS